MTANLHRLHQTRFLDRLPFKFTIFPNLKELNVTISTSSVQLLPRVVSPALHSLAITLLDDPYPTSPAMTSTFLQVPRITELVITFHKGKQRDGDPAANPSAPSLSWVEDLLVRHPDRNAITELRLKGCVAPPSIQAIIGSIPNLETLDISTPAESPFPDTTVSATEMLLSRMASPHLMRLWLHILHSPRAFDALTIVRFGNLHILRLYIDGPVAPAHVSGLTMLLELRSVCIRAPDLDRTITPHLFHCLLKSWPHLHALTLSNHATASNTHSHPLLHLRDLALLTQFSNLSWLMVPVGTECSSPLPDLVGTACPYLVLGLEGSHLDDAASRHVEFFLKRLCPTLTQFIPGYPLGPWADITYYYHKQLSERTTRETSFWPAD